jgi:hypothetical protein
LCVDCGGVEEGAQLLHPQVLAQPGRRVLPQECNPSLSFFLKSFK